MKHSPLVLLILRDSQARRRGEEEERREGGGGGECPADAIRAHQASRPVKPEGCTPSLHFPEEQRNIPIEGNQTYTFELLTSQK